MSVLGYSTTTTISRYVITALFISNYLKTLEKLKEIHVNPTWTS